MKRRLLDLALELLGAYLMWRERGHERDDLTLN